MSATVNCYEIYGLVVASEIELPYLTHESAGENDVFISLGSAPQTLASVDAEAEWYQRNDKQCLIAITGVGRFLIESGRSITVEPSDACDASTLLLWLGGPVMAALLHQRGILPLHATALMSEHGAILIGGPSGAGKSTTAAALMGAGLRIISDDISAIQLDEAGVAWVRPGSFQQRLWQDAIESLGLVNKTWDRLSAYDGKYSTSLEESWCHDPGHVVAIYLLRPDSKEVAIRLVNGHAKLEQLAEVMYRAELMPPHGPAHIQQMQALGALAAQARVADVLRPSTGNTIQAVAEAVLGEQARWTKA